MKNKLIVPALIFAVALSAFSGCGSGSGGGSSSVGGSSSGGGNEETPKYTEMLFDTSFKDGIKVSSLESHEVSFTWWKYGDSDASKDPLWSLGQYCNLAKTRTDYDSSVTDLSLATLFDEGKGITGSDGSKYTLTNKSGSKYIAVDPAVGEYDLKVDTSKEYVNQKTGATSPRMNGEDWVHMILQQQSPVINLSQTEEVIMSLDFTLTELETYDQSIGAAQFQWIFSVHDKSAGQREEDYFWFNVTLFDNRYEIFPGTQMYDSGKGDATGKFIYAPTGNELFGESGGKVVVGKTYRVELNLKDYMKTAFDAAKSKGALERSKWEDMAINGFNIGWEVSNVSKVGVKVANMSLKTKQAGGN